MLDGPPELSPCFVQVNQLMRKSKPTTYDPFSPWRCRHGAYHVLCFVYADAAAAAAGLGLGDRQWAMS